MTPLYVKVIFTLGHLIGAGCSLATAATYFGAGMRDDGAFWSAATVMWLAVLVLRFYLDWWTYEPRFTRGG